MPDEPINPDWNRRGYYDRDLEMESSFGSLAGDKPDERLAEYLLNPDEVLDRLARNEDAIALSLEKWRRIANFFQSRDSEKRFLRITANPIRYFLADSCALCITAAELMQTERFVFQDLRSRKCEACPLAKVDCCREPDSIYERIMNCSPTDSEKLIALCEEMLEAIRTGRKEHGGEFEKEVQRSRSRRRVQGESSGPVGVEIRRRFLRKFQ